MSIRTEVICDRLESWKLLFSKIHQGDYDDEKFQLARQLFNEEKYLEEKEIYVERHIKGYFYEIYL